MLKSCIASLLRLLQARGKVGGGVVLTPALGYRLPQRRVDEIEINPSAACVSQYLLCLIHKKLMTGTTPCRKQTHPNRNWPQKGAEGAKSSWSGVWLQVQIIER
ncbi:MAG TPA: hypothetical protein VGD88_11525 [Opitutaceae bacterium]